MRPRDTRHPYSVDLLECQYCGAGIRPGDRCECQDDEEDEDYNPNEDPGIPKPGM